jgi:hypothetical protein
MVLNDWREQCDRLSYRNPLKVARHLGRREGVVRDHIERENVRYRGAAVCRDRWLIPLPYARGVPFG